MVVDHSRMRLVFLTLLTVPSILISVGLVVGIITNQRLGIDPLIGLMPLYCFVISAALILVFPNKKEWKVAAAINAVPLVAVLLLGTLFWLVGYNG